MAFFLYDKPKTGNGWARLADAYAASGRSADALAKKCLRRGRSQRHGRAEPMGPLRRSFTRDQDRRADALLFAKQPQDAARFLTATSPNVRRRLLPGSRCRTVPRADARYGAGGTVTSDAGLLMDRARYLRSKGYELGARSRGAFTQLRLPAHGSGGAWPTCRCSRTARRRTGSGGRPRSSTTSFPRRARQRTADRVRQVRSLAFLAGSIALDRMNQPSSAVPMFDRYARAGKSLQVQTKGNYRAGRARRRPGGTRPATPIPAGCGLSGAVL